MNQLRATEIHYIFSWLKKTICAQNKLNTNTFDVLNTGTIEISGHS
jgi:hypothetical protein